MLILLILSFPTLCLVLSHVDWFYQWLGRKPCACTVTAALTTTTVPLESRLDSLGRTESVLICCWRLKMSCGLRWSCAPTEQLQISSYPSGECRCLHSAYCSSSVDHPCIGIACRMRRLELSTVANNFSHTFIIYYYVYSGVCIKSRLTFFY